MMQSRRFAPRRASRQASTAIASRHAHALGRQLSFIEKRLQLISAFAAHVPVELHAAEAATD